MLAKIKNLLEQSAKTATHVFFKTDPGHYAQHDQFIGVTAPDLRKICKNFQDLSIDELQILISSPINEERLLALYILVAKYQKADLKNKEALYQFYLRNLCYVNNWNLVDASAHRIIGIHLLRCEKDILFKLAQSEVVWERRISIVSTWTFIRNNDLFWTFKISEILLRDGHDLIHKAVGWMLREAGKRDQVQLIEFLDVHRVNMPRTMLRYAIEKFPKDQRKAYLLKYS